MCFRTYATTNHFRTVTALGVLLIFLGTLLCAPVMAFVCQYRAAHPATLAAAVRQITARQLAAHSEQCRCANCPGMHGGKCCCAGETAPDTAPTIRALCEDNPQAALPGSPLPQAILPGAIHFRTFPRAREMTTGTFAASCSVPLTRLPAPPDTPPRPLLS